MSIKGDGGNNDLEGTAGSDSIYGLGGNDTIDGLGGNDWLIGGEGDDIYTVDHPVDRVYERTGQGSDTVEAGVSFSLLGEQEIEFLRTTNIAGTAALNLAGNAFAQRIDGNAGANILVGVGGTDTMAGHGGNDHYRLDSLDDIVLEADGEGTDVIFSTTSYILAAGQEIEIIAPLVPASTNPINFLGNEFAQRLNGNAGDNLLDGRGGGDTLVGYGGNDTYRIHARDDRVFETAGQGFDTVLVSAAISQPDLKAVRLLGEQSIERFATTLQSGLSPLWLIGNELAQQIEGNDGNNRIEGGAFGGDTIFGFGGDDSIVGNDGGDDWLEGGVGNDFCAGASGNDTAIGGEGDDDLLIGGGNDVADGGAGNDIVSIGGGASGDDTVTGGDGNDILLAGEGNDVVDGGTGNDRIWGGAGTDTLRGGLSTDTIDAGVDTDEDLIQYGSPADSDRYGAHDFLRNLNYAHDRFDFSATPTELHFVTGDFRDGLWHDDLRAALNPVFDAGGPIEAALFDPDGGDLDHPSHVYVAIDANNDGDFAHQDYLVRILNSQGTISLDNFI